MTIVNLVHVHMTAHLYELPHDFLIAEYPVKRGLWPFPYEGTVLAAQLPVFTFECVMDAVEPRLLGVLASIR